MELLGFGSTVAAVFAFAPFLLPTGYLLCAGTNLGGFEGRSWPERVLWSVAVSLPATVCLLALLEYAVLPATAGWVVVGIAAPALICAKRTWGRRPQVERAVGIAAAVMALLALYLVLATVPVHTGGRIFESVAAGDWSVRVPLVDMAMHHGEPLVNPFDGIGGRSPRLHYYFYWTLLCGSVGAVSHLPARAVQAASTVWAAFALISTAFLLMKYLFRPARSVVSLRWLCLLMLPVGCVIGLDVLAMLPHLFARSRGLPAEMEWWRASSDFSLSFHSALLYAPHHAAGLASALLAFLLLVAPVRVPGVAGVPESGRERVVRVGVAALCAACTVGCSTYFALILTAACSLVICDRLVLRKFGTLLDMVAAGFFASMLSVPFVHEVLVSPSFGSDKGAHAHLLRFALRSSGLTLHLAEQAHLAPGSVSWFGFRVVFFVVYLAIELGFFGIVLYVRARADMRRPGALTTAQRAQWALFFGMALPALFLNSDSLAGANDLGRHAGLALRVVAVLWATPMVADFFAERTFRAAVLRSWGGRFALLTIALGLASQVYQAASQRFFLYLSNKHVVVRSSMPFPEMADSGLYYNDLYYGYAAVRDGGVAAGRVLYNPVSTLNSALMLYETREAVAPEPNCMTAFGGDIVACRAAMPALLQLFGGVEYDYVYPKVHQPYVPAAMTMAEFSSACVQHGVAVAVVSDQDPVWQNRDSFAWQAVPVFATSRVRFLRCPLTASSVLP